MVRASGWTILVKIQSDMVRNPRLTFSGGA